MVISMLWRPDKNIRPAAVPPEKEGIMDRIKVYFKKDNTGRKLVYTRCNNGEILVQPWANLDDQMHMILRALANPETCKIEVTEKGFDEIVID